MYDYYAEEEKIVFKNLSSFIIGEILECGQCFRFEKLEENKYKIIACGKILFIEQSENEVAFFPTTEEEFKNIWISYFDIERDYSAIKEVLTRDDDVMHNATAFASGIRILKQEPFECLISFIISQNNRIPKIKQVIKNISQRYGNQLDEGSYAFPTVEQLINVSEAELTERKTGFRAKYIRDAVIKVHTGEIDFESFKTMETEEVRKKLLTIFGVGPKVSDCFLLFSLSRHEVFPTDVWIKRIMQYYYFQDVETHIREIHSLAYDKYGDYAGMAQQYLFHYARNLF